MDNRIDRFLNSPLKVLPLTAGSDCFRSNLWEMFEGQRMILSRREFAAGAAVSVLPLAGCVTEYDMVIYNERKTKTTVQVRVTGVETLFNQRLTIKPDSYRYFENSFEGEVDDTLEVYVNVQGGPEKTETISEVYGTVSIEIEPNDIKIVSSVE